MRRDSRPNKSAGMHSKLLMYPAAHNRESFETMGVLGRGKFGEVVLCRDATQGTAGGQYYAMKKISKTMMCERKNKESVVSEIVTLLRIRHPFVSHLFGYFQDDGYVRLILEFCAGGEFFSVIKRRKNNRLPDEEAKFYTCEIAIALEFLHSSVGVVYRDLKPENVMISYDGHVKLVDFGFAVAVNDDSDTIMGGCGTAMYVAPEIAAKGMKLAHGAPVDWWACGIMMFEMIAGRAPFGDTSDMSKFEVFNNINGGKIKWPSLMKKAAKELIKGLLVPDPSKRFKMKDLRESKWCKDVDFGMLLKRRVKPPWVPVMGAEGDVTNFLKWKDVLGDKISNTDYAQVPESLFVKKVGGVGGVVVCSEYDKSLTMEKEPGGSGKRGFRGSKEKNFGGFGEAAGAVSLLKKRMSKKGGESLKKEGEGTATGNASSPKPKAAQDSFERGSEGGADFAKAAGALNLAKKKMKQQSSRKSIKQGGGLTLKVHAH